MQTGFFNLVYWIVRQIPCGKVTTYGHIAKACGAPKMSRQVGWALHANPSFGEIPCHRVVDRFGRLSGSFAFGGADVQQKLLQSEGITVEQGKVDLQKYLWIPTEEKASV